jgi:co-chaperonin GroES (HSP10)
MKNTLTFDPEPKKRGWPVETKVGDCILFGLYSGAPIELVGQKFLTMREPQVFRRIQNG